MVSRWLVTLRVITFILFLTSALSITWQSLLTFALLLVSLYIFADKPKQNTDAKNSWLENPFKGNASKSFSDLTIEQKEAIQSKLLNYVLYDAEDNETVHNFGLLKQRSECIFAKKAKVWGSPSWKGNLTFEQNILGSIPTFYQFSLLCPDINLDGFVYAFPGQPYGECPEVFGVAVRKLLRMLSDNDPAEKKCMDGNIERKNWVFEFNRITFFVTAFAPFYPDNHCRFAHGSEDCWVLFQPEISFAKHDLPADTPETNWTSPKTVRDRIRKAFKDAGRGYDIKKTIQYPMVHDIVKPVNTMESDTGWWKSENNACKIWSIYNV